MKIQFTLQEQIEALTRLGYEIKEESVLVDESRFNTYKDEQHYINYSVYFNNERLITWMKPGAGEVELAFRSELHKKLLSLLRL
jgi:hypothetical protein